MSMNASSTFVPSRRATEELAGPLLIGSGRSNGLDLLAPPRPRYKSASEWAPAPLGDFGESEQDWEQIIRSYEWRLKAAGGPVLALGAGEGGLMSALQRCGLEVLGCEPSAPLARLGRRKYGLDESMLRSGEIGAFLAWLDRIGQRVQAVFLWRILEYVFNPYCLWHQLTKVLDDGGLIIAHVALLAADGARGMDQGLADENAIVQTAARCGLELKSVDCNSESSFTAFVFQKPADCQGDPACLPVPLPPPRSEWGRHARPRRFHGTPAIRRHNYPGNLQQCAPVLGMGPLAPSFGRAELSPPVMITLESLTHGQQHPRMKIDATSLVTGCAGFIGSHVADELLKLGHTVVGLDDLSGGKRENVSSAVRFYEGSVSDHHLIARLFAEHDFDYIFHLAAYAAEGLSHFIKRFNYTNNLIGSVNLINAAVNAGTVKCFVFTSSIAVYGPNQVPMTEALTPMPEDPYGIAKYAVELDLKEAREMFGLNHVIFRPHNVYGERQNLGDRYRNVIGIFMNQIMQGQPMTIFGDGQQTRAFSYISDVAPVIAKAVHRPNSYNRIFNVGADKPYSVLHLARTVAREMGVETRIVHLEPRKEVVHAFSSHDRVKEVFGDLVANVSLEEGVRRMAAWARATGIQSSRKFEGIEVERNMPPAWRGLVETPPALCV